MACLSAEATCAWLTKVAKINIVAVEPQETWDGTLNMNAVMTDFVVNMFPGRLSKEAATVVDDIAITGKMLDDGRIWELMRCIKDLKIGERTVDIL